MMSDGAPILPEMETSPFPRSAVPEDADLRSTFLAPPLLSPEQPENPRSLNIAVVGIPNVGKSTLVNQLVGTKVSIVSPRAQTTREQTRGVLTEDNTQIVFLDTPGFVSHSEGRRLGLDRSVLSDARHALVQADMILNILDNRHIQEKITPQLDAALTFEHTTKDTIPPELLACKRILVVNKVDTVKSKRALLPVAQHATGHPVLPYDEVFFISALKSLGLDDLKSFLLSSAVPRPWSYHAAQATDQSIHRLVHEAIREQTFYALGQELPYEIQQSLAGWNVNEEGVLEVMSALIVKSNSQKVIVIGKGGEVIRQISARAENELQRIIRRPVKLSLNVKVAAKFELERKGGSTPL